MSDPNPSVPPPPPPEGRQVILQRIYCKDASLEVPLAPQVFTRNWSPQVDVQVNTNADALGEDYYHVTLSITVTSRSEDQVVFLVEAQQAGVFQIKGFDQTPELGAILGAYCPSTIFPFARETIATLVQHAGFPPLLLQPINFDALYAEHLARAQSAAQPRSEGGESVN